jgi:hypothetical protein
MAACQETEASLPSPSTRMELGGKGRGDDDWAQWQRRSMGRLAAYLTRRIPPLRGRRRCRGDGSSGAPEWAVARRIGVIGRPHGATKPQRTSIEWRRQASMEISIFLFR